MPPSGLLLLAPKRARVRRWACCARRTRLRCACCGVRCAASSVACGARRGAARCFRCSRKRAELEACALTARARVWQHQPAARRGRPRRRYRASLTSCASVPTATSSTRQARGRATQRPQLPRLRALPARALRPATETAALTRLARAPGRAIELGGGGGGAARLNPSLGDGERPAAASGAARLGAFAQRASTCRTRRSEAPRKLSLRRCWKSKRLRRQRRARTRAASAAGAGGSRAASAQDTWYPAHRNCSCCKGYVHGAQVAMRDPLCAAALT